MPGEVVGVAGVFVQIVLERREHGGFQMRRCGV